MDVTVVEPMTGRRPTEEGWYAACWKGSRQSGVVEVRQIGRDLVVNLAGSQTWRPLDQFDYLARIYPERLI